MGGGNGCRDAHIGGGICSFQGLCPRKCPHFFGGILRIPPYNAVPYKALQANELAMLSNIGNISENLDTYIDTNSMSGSCSGEGPLCGGALIRPLKGHP